MAEDGKQELFSMFSSFQSYLDEEQDIREVINLKYFHYWPGRRGIPQKITPRDEIFQGHIPI